MTRRGGFVRALVVTATIVGCFFAGSAGAGTKTTVPAKFVQVSVFLKDNGIVVLYASGSLSHDANYPLFGPVPRGDTLTINIQNFGKKVHDFEFAGRTTKPLKPGGKAHMLIPALHRGIYVWRSTLDKGKSFHGTTIVA